MKQLFEKLQQRVAKWRAENYPCSEYPELSEILNYSKLEHDGLRFLRQPQFETIETYLYLRYVLKTPHTIDLYKNLFQADKAGLFEALGITHIGQDAIDDVDTNKVLERIKNNEGGIVKKYKYQTLQEALQLDYASYILALVMGAGKTILIASLIAIEFSIALHREAENEKSSVKLMRNALVFAKGTTIIAALREISDIDFSKIIPPRFYNLLDANLKINYTNDNDKEFDGVVRGSSYNLLVTNTEKIILKKSSNNKNSFFKQAEEEKNLAANLRLQKIISLPNLAIFSDEAHNTYGQNLEKDLKRVRETINHIHEQKDLVCVVNTTGTPYFKKQSLKEVVYWYSLSQGIKDNILKSVENNIVSYDFSKSNKSNKGSNGNKDNEEGIIEGVVEDFFSNYKDVKLPTGQTAKIAFYFNKIEHLEQSKKTIEKTLVRHGLPPSLVLVNTGVSSKDELDEFHNLSNPNSQKRIILLVAKGVEGWNCPSLFATALIKEQTTSNNFVLQASSRCLRQVGGNTHLAKIYLSNENKKTLDKELQETYNTSVLEIEQQRQERIREEKAMIRKEQLPKLVIRKKIKRIVRKKSVEADEIKLQMPPSEPLKTFKILYRLDDGQLKEASTASEVEAKVEYSGLYNVASALALNYHIDCLQVVAALKKQYPSCIIPKHHIPKLSLQIEKQVNEYEEMEDIITQALAIIKIQNQQGNYNFYKDERGYFYHTIRYKENSIRERLLARHQDYVKRGDEVNGTGRNSIAEDGSGDGNKDLGFHFNIYDFASNPEKDFFEKLLNILSEDKRDVDDIYFTGSITDKNKTDFYFEYKKEDGTFSPYYPDFLIRKRDGKFLIVEIKSERDKNLPEVFLKKEAVRSIAAANPDIFRYVIVFTASNSIEDGNADWKEVQRWMDGGT